MSWRFFRQFVIRHSLSAKHLAQVLEQLPLSLGEGAIPILWYADGHPDGAGLRDSILQKASLSRCREEAASVGVSAPSTCAVKKPRPSIAS